VPDCNRSHLAEALDSITGSIVADLRETRRAGLDGERWRGTGESCRVALSCLGRRWDDRPADLARMALWQ
jgi:hypothetical protein